MKSKRQQSCDNIKFSLGLPSNRKGCLVQITEPLEPNFPKQFILSRDSIGHKKPYPTQSSKQTVKYDKENYSYEGRFSLNSVKFQQKSQRMSMTPQRRQSFKEKQIQKETIITNLVTKLNHSEDLREIIAAKLAGNREIRVIDVNAVRDSQLDYYKGMVNELNAKIAVLSKEKCECLKLGFRKKKMRDIGVQVETEVQVRENEGDFYDNLQQTLRLLNRE